MIVAGDSIKRKVGDGKTRYSDLPCTGWERRDPNLITSQSHWHIFRCEQGVWHVNGPARAWDGAIIPMNVDYSCGTEALEAFNNGWSENARYTKRQAVAR